MQLQKGDWVQTENGEQGKVVLVSRLTVFVEIRAEGKGSYVDGYLESQLTKIKRPEPPDTK